MVNNTPGKKRHFCRNIIIVMAFAVLLAGGAFAAARNAHAKAHTHSYRWVTKKNATCKETGYRNYECACGSILNSQTIDKTPHTWNRGSANCTTAKKCTYCGYVAQAATGHSWNRAAANCTTAKKCNTCGYVAQAATGHSLTWVTKKAASCTETGYRNLECHCGYVQSSATIDKTPHNWNRGSADCTNAKVCRNCGTVGEAAKGHSYSWSVKTAASCTTDGLKEYRCSACGRVDQTQVINKWGHHYDIPSASCTEDQKCTTCGYINEYAKGHNWDRPAATCTLPKKCLRCGKIGEKATGQHVGTQWVVVVEPTCHSGGIQEWRCDCGHSLNGREIPANNNHNWVEDHTEPGNCAAWGSTYYRCTNDGCKQTKREANIPPTGHANRRWVVTKEPTKTADGVESYICEYCDDVAETRTLYLISYVANGGKNIPGNQTKRAGIDLTLDTARPTRSGYTFKGWGTTTAEADYQPGAIYSDNKRTNLYAIWDPNKYQVGYSANGGVGAPPGQTKFHGVSLTLSDVIPTRDDYVFVGWAEGSATATKANYSAGGTYSKNASVTLYAVWAPDKFNVKYNLKGGKNPNNDNAFSTRTYDYGTNVRISSVAPTRTGYTFKGWDTSSKATKVVYDPGDLYTAYRTVTLYAVWEENEYTVTFYCYEYEERVEEIKAKYGEEIVLPSPSLFIPGEEAFAWTTYDHLFPGASYLLSGEKIVVKGDEVYHGFLTRSDSIQGKHDFSGYQRVSGLDYNFIKSAEGGEVGVFGFNQDYFSDREKYTRCWELQWALYESKYPNCERELYSNMTGDNDLINDFKANFSTAKYNEIVALLESHTETRYEQMVVGEEIIIIPRVVSPNAFSIIDANQGNSSISEYFKKYYGLKMKDLLEGSCGLFATLNTCLYLDNGNTFTETDLHNLMIEYIKDSKGLFDWVERIVSGGEGPASICTFLQHKFTGCNAKWKSIEGVSYTKIKNLLNQDYPVILAFNRSDGSKLRFYELAGDQLEQRSRASSHYFVVTGVYENPDNPDKHFLEVSSIGRRQYICWEEYIAGKGINLFSTYVELSFK